MYLYVVGIRKSLRRIIIETLLIDLTMLKKNVFKETVDTTSIYYYIITEGKSLKYVAFV